MLPLAPVDSQHEEPPANPDTTAIQPAHNFLKRRKELEKGEHDDAFVGHDCDLLVPYQPGTSDDDDGSDLSLPDEPNHVDSG